MKQDLNNDGKVTMQEKILAALASYGRHFLGAAIALYMTGNTDPGDLIKGGKEGWWLYRAMSRFQPTIAQEWLQGFEKVRDAWTGRV